PLVCRRAAHGALHSFPTRRSSDLARELDRGGQAFLVHNRIETIETIAARVRALAPRARIGVAHGQLPAEALERVMQGFVSGEVEDRKSTRLNSSHVKISYAVFCLK